MRHVRPWKMVSLSDWNFETSVIKPQLSNTHSIWLLGEQRKFKTQTKPLTVKSNRRWCCMCRCTFGKYGRASTKYFLQNPQQIFCCGTRLKQQKNQDFRKTKPDWKFYKLGLQISILKGRGGIFFHLCPHFVLVWSAWSTSVEHRLLVDDVDGWVQSRRPRVCYKWLPCKLLVGSHPSTITDSFVQYRRLRVWRLR